VWLWPSARQPAKIHFPVYPLNPIPHQRRSRRPCLSIRQLEHPDQGTLRFLCSFAQPTPTIGIYNPLRLNDWALPVSSRIMRVRWPPPLASRCILLSLLFFHGDNMGSNPVGDANKIKGLRSSCFRSPQPGPLRGPIGGPKTTVIFAQLGASVPMNTKGDIEVVTFCLAS
jgi:hypothetical protein